MPSRSNLADVVETQAESGLGIAADDLDAAGAGADLAVDAMADVGMDAGLDVDTGVDTGLDLDTGVESMDFGTDDTI